MTISRGKDDRHSRRVIALLAWLVSWSCLTQVVAQDQSFGAQALRGVTAITVTVEGVDRNYSRYGLTADELKTRMESQLTAAGLRVINVNDAASDPQASQLLAHVTAYEGSYSLISYRIGIELKRKLPLDASGQNYIAQSVWSDGRSGILNPSDLPRLYGFATELLQHFIAAYGTSNVLGAQQR